LIVANDGINFLCQNITSYQVKQININKYKMKCAILASIIVGSTAFAPTQQVCRSSTTLDVGPNAAYANEPGVLAPLGVFDPCALLDGAEQDRFDHLRAVELKHGRVSMLAVVGYLTTYGTYIDVDVVLVVLL
jgi:hypothetical protein